MIEQLASFTCHCGIYAVGRCDDCGSYLCRVHGVAQGNGWVCASGCRELERQHRLAHEERLYRRLVDQIRSMIAVFTPRMTAAGNPGATQLGLPQLRRRSSLIGNRTTETLVPRGPLGWRLATVGTGSDPESANTVQLAAIGIDIKGQLVDLTHSSHEPPPWTLGDTPGAPPHSYDDYDYRYLAEREVPRSIDELLTTHTGSGLTADLTRCYYCGHAGFHMLTPIGSLWALENWPRACEDCIECWVGP